MKKGGGVSTGRIQAAAGVGQAGGVEWWEGPDDGGLAPAPPRERRGLSHSRSGLKGHLLLFFGLKEPVIHDDVSAKFS
ncbi:hypothetical protein GCM10027256_34310 [Novispirillum itersonii subsp. nipponicum]